MTVAPDGVVWWGSSQYGIASFDETKHGFSYFDPGSMGVGGTVTDLVALNGWKSGAMALRYAKSSAAARAREAHRRLSPGERL